MQTVQNLDQLWFLAGAFLLGFLLAWLILPFFLRRNANKYLAQIETLEHSLRQRDRDLSGLRNQLDGQRLRTETVEAENVQLSAHLNTLQADYDAAGLALDETQSILAAAATDSATLQAELDEANDALAVMRAAAGDAHAKLATADQVRSDLEAALQLKADEADALARKVHELNAHAAAIEVKLAERTLAATPAAISGVIEADSDQDEIQDDPVNEPEDDGERNPEETVPTAAGSSLNYRTNARLALVLQEGETVEDALWQRELDLVEARAEADYLRAGLSALTSISAELAGHIDQRRRDYAKMVAQLTALLVEIGDQETLALLNAGLTDGESAGENRATPANDAQTPMYLATRSAASAQSGTPADLSADLSFEQLRRLTVQLDTYKRNTAAYQAQLDDARAQQVVLEGELHRREQALTTLTQQMAGLEARLGAANEDIQTLDGELAARNQAYLEAKNQLAEMGPELAETAERKQALEAQVAEQAAALEAAQADHHALLRERDGLSAELAARSDELEQMNERLTRQAAELEELHRSVDQAQGELSEALTALLEGSEIDTAVDPAADVTAADALFNVEDGQRSTQIDITTLAQAPYDGEDLLEDAQSAQHATRQIGPANALAAQIAAAQRQFGALRAELDARDLALAETKDQLDGVTNARSELMAELAETQAAAQSEQESLRAEIADKQAQIDSLSAEKTQLEAELAELQQELTALQVELADVEKSRAQLAAQLAQTEAAITTAWDQLAPALNEAGVAPSEEVNSRIEALRGGGVSERDVQVKLLEAGGAAAILRLHEAQNASAAANSRASDLELALTEQQSAAQTQVDELNDARQALEAQLAALADEKLTLSEQIQAREEALATAQSEAESLSRSRDELEQSLAAVQRELSAVQADKDAVATQLEAQAGELEATRSALDSKVALLSATPAIAELAEQMQAYPALKNNAANAAVRLGAMPIMQAKPQDLSDVKGVGRAFEQRLYDAGIGTFWELANLSDEELRTILELTDWQLRSISFDEIREDAQHLAAESGTIGKLWDNLDLIDDLEPLRGIGRVYERRLYAAGILTYEALAAATVEELAQACRAPKLHVPDYADWIEQAKALVAARDA